jgi:ABC-type multidrug transport system fused ATPase/permease subunit
MDNNLLYFLLGVVVAVPVGIFTNLITPKIQTRLEGRSKISAARKSSEAQKELDEIREYYNARDKLYLKTISSATIAFIFYVIANAIWAFPFFYIGTATENYRLSETFTAIATLIAVIFFIIAITIIINHLRIISKVRNFTKYEQDMKQRISQLEAKGLPVPNKTIK